MGMIADYGNLQLELSLERPLLADEQLARRGEILANQIQDLMAYILVIPDEDERGVHGSFRIGRA
jgi:hypothetical protein